MSQCVLGVIMLTMISTSLLADTRLPMLTNEEAWKRLPDAPARVEPLPEWARAMAGWQPITTARMLELDALHRTGDRLDARFRAIVRWAAADANQCESAKAMAAADYRRAVGGLADLSALMKQPEKLAEIDRLGASFARNMMLNAAAVTDAEVKRLIDVIGDERMVALVALVAHASFQDRIFLALNVSSEHADVPPVMTQFGRPKPQAPAKPGDSPPQSKPASSSFTQEAWLRTQKGLEEQKQRPGRIRVPSIEELTARLGQNHPALWQTGIIWSRVCYTHQPSLTDAWFDCANAFRQEAKADPLFTNAIFWVVTDSLNCFY